MIRHIESSQNSTMGQMTTADHTANKEALSSMDKTLGGMNTAALDSIKDH